MRVIKRYLSSLMIVLALLLGASGMSTEVFASSSHPAFAREGSEFSAPVLTKSKKKKNKKSNNGSSEKKNDNNTTNNNAANGSNAGKDSNTAESSKDSVKEDGSYTSKEEVAEYIHLYGHLPDNYITKNEAKKLGWVNSEGNLGEVAPGKSIGGDYFGNYEGQLPEKKGRDYHECDIDFTGGRRNAKRIIYSNDGLIYYTEDHYETFEQLY